jgi:pimeloyl-ACP methyl ester carboxylesterase
MDSLNFEEVNIPTDTVQLNGIFLKPTNKPKATILFFHGAGGNITNYLFMTKPLVAAGYQVFMIDFRGYGKSTGKPTHLNIAKDGQVVLDYLLKRKDVASTKMILYGASMGSQVAVLLAKNNANKVMALVLDGAISSFTDIAADKSPEAQRDMIRQHLSSPYAAKEDIKSLDKMPKLFIHSKSDADVPYEEGQLVYNNATGRKVFFTYEGKHLEALKVDPQGVMKEINKLLK